MEMRKTILRLEFHNFLATTHINNKNKHKKYYLHSCMQN